MEAPTAPYRATANQRSPSRQSQSSVQRSLSQRTSSTKWWVSGSAFVVLVASRDAAVAWQLVGSIAAAFNCKLLKRVLNHERPDGAQKSDPGMPSSHAQSLAFLGTSAAIGLRVWCQDATLALAAPGAMMALAVFLTWLRVELGFHTGPQVVVGFVLGAVSALAWRWLGTEAALPMFTSSAAATLALWALVGVAGVAFAVKNVLAWAKEKAQ
ncbi:unnamed protein product [Pedinophyceae sp. YPF-701]|nr:unnamed protein product [Pedinophyceae sp. YPF-701]